MEKRTVMLTKPNYGWTKISIAGIDLGTASYIDDIPSMIFDACISYLESNRNNIYPTFSITFNGEGHLFGLFEFSDSLFAIEEKQDEHGISLANLSDSLGECSYELIRKFALECADSVENDIEEWKKWVVGEDDYDEEDISVETEQEQMKETYLDKTKQIRQLCMQ